MERKEPPPQPRWGGAGSGEPSAHLTVEKQEGQVLILDIIAGFLRKSLSALKRRFSKTDVISMTY